MADQFDDQIEKLRRMREEAELFAQIQANGFNAASQSITGNLKLLGNINAEEKKLAEIRKNAVKAEQEMTEFRRKQQAAGKILTQQQEDELALSESLNKSQREYADMHEKTLGAMKSQLSIGTALKTTVFAGLAVLSEKILAEIMTLPGFLSDADNALRKMTMNMGASGAHAQVIRDATLEAAQYAAQFGQSVGDLANMQAAYTEQTGRANGMNTENLKSISAMAAGTSLGKEGAAAMAGSFAIAGLNASRVADLVGDITNESDALGVSSSSVLKTLNANIKRSQDFSFVNGINGLKQMAIQAQTLKISMEDTFNAAEKARTLEGSLAMAAELMVLGGNFSKTDPFQLSFLSRNDPAKFQKAISDMTRGIATFNESTGEIAISAYDMDRLRQASEATGVSMESLTKSAKDFTTQSKAKSSLFVGTAEDKEYIASMAKMDKKGGFTIQIGDTAVELSKLTGEQVGLLRTQKSTLEARAKDAVSFNEVFGNFLLELKSTALPLIKILVMLLGGVKSVMDGMRAIGLGKISGSIALLGIAGALYKSASILSGASSLLTKFTGLGGSAASTAVTAATNTAGSATGGAGASAGMLSNLGGSMGTAATIAAIGVAAVGLGYGFKLAAEGAASLANAMKGMTGGEMAGLLGVVVGLGAAFVGFGFAMSAALTTVGLNPAALAGVAVVAALGVAAMAAGYGVNLATKGIGDMVGSFASLGSVDYSSLINLMGVVGTTLSGDMGNFGKIKEMVTYLKDTQTSMVNEISKIMNRPIQLQLAGDSMMTCNIEVHNNIDGDKMVSKFSKKFQVAITDATKGLRNL